MPSSKAKSPLAHMHFKPLPSLFRICVAMGSVLNLAKLLKLILRLTMKELRAQQGSVLLFDKTSDQLKMLASRGMPAEIAKRGYLPRKGSIAEWVIKHDKPLLLNDVRGSKQFTSIATKRPIYSSMCVPLRAHGRVIGTINITRTRPERFTDPDLDTLTILASQAAVSIENARLDAENMQTARLAAIGQTVAAISHCTRNMLVGLKGGAGIIELGSKNQDWKMVEHGWGLVKRGTDRITLLVNDMLNFSKERTPARATVDLTRVIHEVFTNLSEMAGAAQVRLSTRVEAAASTLYADPDMLHRALLNLVMNAIDAVRENLREGGQVEVIAERVDADSPVVRRCLKAAHGQFELIHVRDSGPGIPPHLLSDLFQPFSSSKGSKGTGLGLAVTQKIAREHGGDVTVESVVGQGTDFTIILPVVAPPAEEQSPPSEQEVS